ncbi:hypothetical protein [Croceibacterium aestuarii]|uniref:hypothetical protein n=1 Tax=Croceibacterium aestuarii TaxID=3064139 RepID=UPI00272E524D|nr:hypothetical protein [Croceibacterium sp. D39]
MRTTGSPFTARERRLRRNGWIFNAWLFAFAATFLIGGRVFRYADSAPEGPPAIALSLLPLLPSAFAFHAFLRFVREADEMIRAVLVEGLMFGFATVMVFWGAIQLPEHVWLPKVSADLLMGVLLVATGFGGILAQWRRK